MIFLSKLEEKAERVVKKKKKKKVPDDWFLNLFLTQALRYPGQGTKLHSMVRLQF